jgi:hypothetical protein
MVLVFTQDFVPKQPLHTALERPIEESQQSCSYYGESYLTKEKDAYELDTEGSIMASVDLKAGSRPTLGESKSTQQTTNISTTTTTKISYHSKKSFATDSPQNVWTGKAAGPMALLCKVGESQTRMRRVVKLLCRLCQEM